MPISNRRTFPYSNENDVLGFVLRKILRNSAKLVHTIRKIKCVNQLKGFLRFGSQQCVIEIELDVLNASVWIVCFNTHCHFRPRLDGNVSAWFHKTHSRQVPVLIETEPNCLCYLIEIFICEHNFEYMKTCLLDGARHSQRTIEGLLCIEGNLFIINVVRNLPHR